MFLLEQHCDAFSATTGHSGANDAIKQLVRFPGLFEKVKYTFVCGRGIYCGVICYFAGFYMQLLWNFFFFSGGW